MPTAIYIKINSQKSWNCGYCVSLWTSHVRVWAAQMTFPGWETVLLQPCMQRVFPWSSFPLFLLYILKAHPVLGEVTVVPNLLHLLMTLTVFHATSNVLEILSNPSADRYCFTIRSCSRKISRKSYSNCWSLVTQNHFTDNVYDDNYFWMWTWSRDPLWNSLWCECL